MNLPAALDQLCRKSSLASPAPVFDHGERAVGGFSASHGVGVQQMPALPIAIDAEQEIPPKGLMAQELQEPGRRFVFGGELSQPPARPDPDAHSRSDHHNHAHDALPGDSHGFILLDGLRLLGCEGTIEV